MFSWWHARDRTLCHGTFRLVTLLFLSFLLCTHIPQLAKKTLMLLTVTQHCQEKSWHLKTLYSPYCVHSLFCVLFSGSPCPEFILCFILGVPCAEFILCFILGVPCAEFILCFILGVPCAEFILCFILGSSICRFYSVFYSWEFHMQSLFCVLFLGNPCAEFILCFILGVPCAEFILLFLEYHVHSLFCVLFLEFNVKGLFCVLFLGVPCAKFLCFILGSPLINRVISTFWFFIVQKCIHHTHDSKMHSSHTWILRFLRFSIILIWIRESIH